MLMQGMNRIFYTILWDNLSTKHLSGDVWFSYSLYVLCVKYHILCVLLAKNKF